eukprot:UN04950
MNTLMNVNPETKQQVTDQSNGITVLECVQKLKTIITNGIKKQSQTTPTRLIRVRILDVKRGSLITAAAGFSNSSFITCENDKKLESNNLYSGTVNRTGDQKKILLSVIERDGTITTEMMFTDNSKVEEQEVMLINTDPLQKLEPFLRLPTQEKNIQLIVDLILRNQKLEKFVRTCTCQNKERSMLLSSVGSKRDRVAARLRSTLRVDLETMQLLEDLGDREFDVPMKLPPFNSPVMIRSEESPKKMINVTRKEKDVWTLMIQEYNLNEITKDEEG